MRQYLSFAPLSAGFVAVLIGYTSAAAIVYQAALAAGTTSAEAASWLWALGIGMGISTLALTLRYKVPVLIAWSTPGAALLVTSLSGVAYSDAIGAFLFCAVLIVLSALTGWIDRLMRYLPTSLATALLAGVLLRFGLNLFPAFVEQQLLVGSMIIAYVIGKWRGSLYAIPLTFAVGVLMAIVQGELQSLDGLLHITTPVWTTPTFNGSVLIGVGLPLFIVTMASQNLTGVAVLRAHGYETPASPLIGWSGAMGLIFAPFGGFAFNLAAITAALCMGKDIDENPAKRYPAAVWAGFFYLLAGLFGGGIVAFFNAFPAQLVAAIAGLALIGTIGNSLSAAVKEETEREAAILCFVITASSVSFFGIGAPFWGLVIGLAVHRLMMWRCL